MRKLLSLPAFALTIATLLAVTPSAHAFTTLFCLGEGGKDGAQVHFLLKGEATFACSTLKDTSEEYPDPLQDIPLQDSKYFRIDMAGVGPGLAWTGGEGAIMTCPTVRAAAMGLKTFTKSNGKVKDGTTDFYGIDAEAALLAGGHAAVFSNKRGGVCILAGFQAGLGVAVEGVKMTVTRISKADWDILN